MFNNISVNSRTLPPTSSVTVIFRSAILIVFALLAGSSLNANNAICSAQSRSDHWGLGTDQPVPGDYDGDARADLAVFRPGEGCWYIFNSSNGTFKREPFGLSTDQPVAADYDGDGKDDIAVFRPSTRVWYYLKSSDGSIQSQQFGASGDIPVPGDFDGNGLSNFAVWRPSTGYWYTSLNASTNFGAVRLGQVGDVPVAADYDGDGKTDVTVFRPSAGTFYIWQSSVNSLRTRQWGISTDRPLAGDFDMDGRADIGVFRPSTGTWFVLKSSDSNLFAQPWGQSSDRLIAHDYDGNGQADMAVFSAGGGIWNILLNPVPLTVPDTTPPVISGVSSSGVTSSASSVSWTTDEASDTQVEFGTTTSYGSSSALNTSMVTSHSASLSGLSANTLYHYRVKSRDAAGNLATSGDFTFTTHAPPDTTPPVISAVTSSGITSSGATVTWTTNEASNTQVDYGTTTSYGSSTALNASVVTSHSATLSGLSASTLYHYRVKSRDVAGNLASSGDFTFTTTSSSPPPTGGLYVATNGNDSNPGTLAQPFRTLSRGVSALTPGSVLYVRAGTYTGSTQLENIPSGSSWLSPVTIRAYPGETVTIVPQPGQIAIYFNNGNHHIIIDGIIVDATGGHFGIKVMQGSHHIRIQNTEVKNAPVSGIQVSGDAGSTDNEFINCRVHDNGFSGQFDHGFYISNANNLIDGCDIYGNSGYGVHIYSGDNNNNNVVRNSRIHGQTGKAGVLVTTGTGHRIYNNIIYGNAWGITLFYGGSSTVYNNTVSNNVVGVYVCCGALASTIDNNILYNNSGSGLYVEDAAVGVMTVRNNISSQNPGGNFIDNSGRAVLSGNFIGNQYDPRLVNAAGNDYRILAGSQAIDTGRVITGLATDCVGTARPRGLGYDIGGYEF